MECNLYAHAQITDFMSTLSIDEGILVRALIDRPHLLVGKSCMRFYRLICYLDTYSIYAATMNDYFSSLDSAINHIWL